ncbi:hypothetical protein P7K49_029602 [Saguinus oedipus]|uniref:Uncharacterized protein n=1 Tax=Saguinus oedipus TaxID=9490 RepID=A0ABQ9U7N4_SAGOE|nr:hypothetical protein P7K49_029602 [Saguinus oedipus]
MVFSAPTKQRTLVYSRKRRQADNQVPGPSPMGLHQEHRRARVLQILDKRAILLEQEQGAEPGYSPKTAKKKLQLAFLVVRGCRACCE